MQWRERVWNWCVPSSFIRTYFPSCFTASSNLSANNEHKNRLLNTTRLISSPFIGTLTDLASHSRRTGSTSPSFHPWDQRKHSIPQMPWRCYGWWRLSAGRPWRKGRPAGRCHCRSVETNGLRQDRSLSTAKCSLRPLSLVNRSPWSAQTHSPNLSEREKFIRGVIYKVCCWMYGSIRQQNTMTWLYITVQRNYSKLLIK